MSALNTKSAVELRAKIGLCDISPVELLNDCITAIDAQNDAVNAVVTTCFDAALLQAKEAEKQAKDGAKIGPLHGLPVLIKDLTDTAGIRTSYGSKYFAGHVPEKDAIIVEKLKAAGAIVIGKTNTPEFGAGANTSNLVFGSTRNPYDISKTSGGSSGGSAAALACDMAPLASGSDLGGSLRIPASFCGIVGMRPTPGMIASHNHVSGFSPLWTDGPMARCVADMALMLSAVTGFDPRDPLSTPASVCPNDGFVEPMNLAELKVGFSTDLGMALVDQNIHNVFEVRKQVLARPFGSACDLDLDLSAATDVFKTLRGVSLFAAYGDLVESHHDTIGENVVSNVLEAQRYSLWDVARADAAHTQIYRAFQMLFDDVDVLICPATAVSPFAVEDNHPTQINGETLDGYYAWYAITWALSLVGCPIVTIPCGMDHKGMPIGIQLVGRRYSDFSLTRIAFALENALNMDGIGQVRLS